MYTIKNLQADERPREKVKKYGINTLNNSELLALIITTGSKNKSAIKIGEEIILNIDGLKNLMNVTINDLLEIDGIGEAKAIQILSVVELTKRISKESHLNSVTINSPQSIYNAYAESYRHNKKESFIVILLDSKNKIIKDVIVSQGSLNSSIVHPREVILEAIKNSAAKMILLHNHPSGDPNPSADDIKITERLKNASEIVGIDILDHIIIGYSSYYSFKENKISFS